MKPTLSNHHLPISSISPGDDDLQDPKAFIEFLISANIRLVRLEFLLELHEDGRSLPRRQEAEAMRTRNGDTALVEIHEYEKLHVNDVTGRWDQMRIDFRAWLQILSQINSITSENAASAASVGADWADNVFPTLNVIYRASNFAF